MSGSQRSIKTRALDGVRRVFTKDPFERVMLFFLGGVEYGGFWPRFIPGPHLYPIGAIRRATRDGIRYDLDLSCLMQWYVFWGFHEPQRERLYSLVSPGDVVLDVGTNIGETLLHFAQLTGDRGFVYGFEPDDVNHRAALHNIELNPMKNVEVLKLGIADRKGTVGLHRVDPNNRGMNRILDDSEKSDAGDSIAVDIDTLDRVAVERQLSRIDVIKIDIEGYEMHALRGANDVLAKFKPKLFIEVGYSRLLSHGTSPREMVTYLEERGYRVHHAETDARVRPTYDFSAIGDGSIDVYAVPEEPRARSAP